MNFTINNVSCAVSSSHRSPGADHQLELAFAAASVCPPAGQRQRRLSRANWWFRCMRQIVDRARDWQPAAPARPEQIWFPNTHRNVSLAS